MPKAKKRVEWSTGDDAVDLAEARRRMGHRIRKEREGTIMELGGPNKKRHMRQSELARRLGISQKTLNNYESGNSFPSMPIYIALCRELQLGRVPLVS